MFLYSLINFQAGIIEEMMEDAMETLEDQVRSKPRFMYSKQNTFLNMTKPIRR
jgi:hypothetical protein